MKQKDNSLGQAWIRTQVIDQGLCTGCGACVNLCPYQKIHKDHTVHLHVCDRVDGRCRNYCPRSPVDLDRLRRALFDPADIVPELGPFKGLYMTRATDEALRKTAQHGGTVSSLIMLALEEGLIDATVLAGKSDNHLPHWRKVNSAGDVPSLAGSRFVVSPTVAGFNALSLEANSKIGVVATPCQALALAKMRVNPWPDDIHRTQKLALVIGLFCGWTLNWPELVDLLENEAVRGGVAGMDIPPSKYARMEVYTPEGTVELPIEKVNTCVREACGYCFDMTCEFADLSVGSGRSNEGWEVDREWNQVIVRSELGRSLLMLAKDKKILEFRNVPQGNIAKLKKASTGKKRACLHNLSAKTGSGDHLIYLDCEDAAVCRIKGV